MNKKDEFFRQVASAYVEREGDGLRQEAAWLNRVMQYPTEKLERRVMKAVGLRKRRIIAKIAAIAATAACLVLLFFGGRALLRDIRFIRILPNIPNITEQTDQPPDDSLLISLSFQVPSGFTQTDAQQDQGKSIYYFDDQMGDHVVLTLEEIDASIDISSYTQLDINNASAYAASREGYQIMTFEKDHVLYTLTCRYDVNTLLRFGEKIL
ncbi:MAG: hypothetical protein LBM60_06895 [Clostridium sp.]|jgi:hypothetical protein|nr:hypothetical protein [Clostridium sp.]